jgi:hypothetical protein
MWKMLLDHGQREAASITTLEMVRGVSRRLNLIYRASDSGD